MTHNGKRLEHAARDAVNGDPILNTAALRNPGCLAEIRAAVEAADTPGDSPATAEPGTAAVDEVVLRDVGRVWCQVLGVRHVEPDDAFADLGGTSRQVMSLLRRIKLDLGTDVPVQEFTQEPTVRGLARAVVETRSVETPEVPLLRPGTGRPVFVLGDAWGQLNSYAGLVEQMGTERPVHGLPLAMAEESGRRRTVPEIAADCLARIRKVQPDGPYSLLGYSFGELVTYAVAVALVAAGAEVPYLGLVDVVPPLAALTPREAAARRWIGRLGTVFSKEGPAALARRLHLPARFGDPDDKERFFLGSYDVANDYRPPSYTGPVTYYLAEGRPPLIGNTLPAWRRVAPHLLVTEVPGHHGNHDDHRPGVLSEQFVGTLAARVTATLR
jgi:acetoacetyl-CoA synthetase